MATKTALKSGYVTDTGVLSATGAYTPTSADIIKIGANTTVCMKNGVNWIASQVICSGTGAYIGVPNGSVGSLTLKNAGSSALRFISVGHMEYDSSTTALVPKGQG